VVTKNEELNQELSNDSGLKSSLIFIIKNKNNNKIINMNAVVE
jgi:hypothetical protein